MNKDNQKLAGGEGYVWPRKTPTLLGKQDPLLVVVHSHIKNN